MLVVIAIAGAVARPAVASCVPLTAEQRFAMADVIFDGVALDGATATGIERFRVVRYVKGSGPEVARVATGRTTRSITSVAIAPVPGETWRIYARRRPDGTFATDECIGSRRLEAARPWTPAATVSGPFGTRSLAAVSGGRVTSVSVRRGGSVRFRFNFRPVRVVVSYRGRVQRLTARRVVTWRVPALGTYVVRVTAAGTRVAGADAVPFTSRFALRVTARR